MNWIIVKKFPLQTDLSAVSSYLQQRGVVHQIYEDAGEQVVAVKDAQIVDTLLQFLEGVTQGKVHLDPSINSHVVAQPSLSLSLFDQIKTLPVTSILILFSIIGAALVWLDQEFHYVSWFTFQNLTPQGFVPLAISLNAGEYWRLLTPAFLHFSFIHVLFNILWVWDLGRRLELLLGKIGYVIFFVSTGVISNAAQYLWSGPSLFGGMSGVVYALVGFIIVSHKLAPHKLTAVSPGIMIFMIAWLGLCMTGAVDYFIGGSVANAAHLGGLIAGCVFALIYTLVAKKSNTRSL